MLRNGDAGSDSATLVSERARPSRQDRHEAEAEKKDTEFQRITERQSATSDRSQGLPYHSCKEKPYILNPNPKP